jgi:hypothetical protein
VEVLPGRLSNLPLSNRRGFFANSVGVDGTA